VVNYEQLAASPFTVLSDDEGRYRFLKEEREMRSSLILFAAVLLTGMGGKRPAVPQPGTEGSTVSPQPFYEQFKSLGATYGAQFVTNSVTFSFGSFFGSTIGMCRFSSSGKNHVELSKSHWERGPDTFREMLMFHELGHCLLGRGHKNSRHSSGRPESLMNSFLFDQKTYLANRDQYLKELYTSESSFAVQFLPANHTFGDCGFRPK
jgi:hypothetical protein